MDAASRQVRFPKNPLATFLISTLRMAGQPSLTGRGPRNRIAFNFVKGKVR